MLADRNYHNELNSFLAQAECEVELPKEWADQYFSEEGVEPTSFHERRRYARFKLRTKAILQVEQTYPAIVRSDEPQVVYTCDIGRGGLGFLHSEQLYPGEICELWLTTRKIRVEVTRCRYHNEKCFQIGVRPL